MVSARIDKGRLSLCFNSLGNSIIGLLSLLPGLFGFVSSLFRVLFGGLSGLFRFVRWNHLIWQSLMTECASRVSRKGSAQYGSRPLGSAGHENAQIMVGV